MISRARLVWSLVEPYHALTYFAPEAHQAFEAIGLRGFWRGYFAGRAAPLGEVGPGVVTACFFGFHPDFVARALPAIWSTATPDEALRARLTGVDLALRRLFAEDLDGTAFAGAAALGRQAITNSSPGGRPIYAANARLPWPEEPHLALWHFATLLREHRGDGHVAALTVAGVGPCEAHVCRIAHSGLAPETIKPYRGWNDQDWIAATDRLRERGWLEGGGLSAQGREIWLGIEGETDRLAEEPLARLGPDGLAELMRLLGPATSRLVEAGAVPYPNPMGVPPPPR
ncbi:MAG: hypothetical protein JJLCMIEE_03061 [Acidimicrobiales bacterium]|nr:MAG: hypothetical protein EDR02_07925 [Actinomycetota bacterium]MBV6509945.1 hypothetical protein [Acidimicrobiales bacterium]RIK08565.1 MAG: hypothetical protein DCC48_01080 [Acidobacteriota bacterium]